MSKEREHGDEESRRKEMGRVLGNIFHSVNFNNEHFQSLKDEVEKELETWNRNYVETISPSDLEDCLFEVGACVFGGALAVEKLLETQWNSEDSDHTHWDEFVDRFEELDYECDHTFNHSKKILQDMGYSDSEIEVICEWFGEKGGYCDCEVHLNVIMNDIVY